MTRARVAVIGASALVLLAGCGAGSTGDAPDPEEPSSPVAEDTSDLQGTVSIYAAASLEAAFTDVIAGFEQHYPEVTVEPPTFDGSSTLVTQLVEGAPADVFASADEATMADLVAAGLAADDPVLFATNTLVIAVAPGNPLGITDLTDLDDVDYAVCAPEVPCGAATQTLFELAGVQVEALSQEQNVTAVAERVARGEVDAGLVYATDVATRDDVLDAVVPAGAEDVVNRYPVTALTGASEPAEAFVAYLLSDDGQGVLAEYGFGPP